MRLVRTKSLAPSSTRGNHTDSRLFMRAPPKSSAPYTGEKFQACGINRVSTEKSRTRYAMRVFLSKVLPLKSEASAGAKGDRQRRKSQSFHVIPVEQVRD